MVFLKNKKNMMLGEWMWDSLGVEYSENTLYTILKRINKKPTIHKGNIVYRINLFPFLYVTYLLSVIYL